MRTRNIFAGLSAMALMAFATGCNDDLRPDINQGGNTGAEDGPGVYMGVSFTMPTQGGTRSWTDGPNSSNNGEEIGTEIENNVNEVLLVLAKKADNAFICSSTVSKNSLTIATGANKTYQAKAKFSLDNLQLFYADADVKKNDAGNYDINVFVFCNSTKEIVDAVASAEYGNVDWVNTYANVTVTGQQTEGSIWSSTDGGSFLMSNVEIATREIPGAIDIWDNYTTSDKCFHLSHVNEGSSTIDNGATGRGAVKVERAAARFDFRDASDNKDQTYPVLYTINAAGEQENLVVSVRLTKMGLVNMSNRFYYLPRVSDNGLMTGANYELCGTEKPWYSDAQGTLVQGSGNYVVGPYAENFVTTGGVATNFSNYFNYPFFNNDGTIDNNNIQNGDRWSTIVIKDLLEKGSNDNWENSQQENKKGTYKVWRYATENVIPGIEQQVNGISTGVVFKAKMIGSTEPLKEGTTLPQNEKDVIAALNNSSADFGDHESAPILYKHDGRLYYKFKNLYDAAIAASFSYTFDDSNNIIPSWNRSNSLYKALFGNGGTGYSITLKGPDMTPGAAEGAKTDVTYSDDLAVSENCVYKLYTKWRELATGKVIDESAGVAFKKAATDPDNANITLYQRSYDVTDGWGYYCYYYYWNRHNDNGKNGIMGPMEFDVVRNNVYKLAVTAVKDLGHPRISENDPNKPNPGTPDEETKIYMTVDAEVIPWVVRVNDIVFE